MNASDYPVFFPFKGQDGTYYGPNGSVGLYHLGNDYGTPVGTPLTVGGTLLGYTGATGIVSGPHVHIAKWKTGNIAGGYYVAKYNQTYFDPSDVWNSQGVVSQIGENGESGKFIRWTSDGFTYEAFHLSDNSVRKVGDNVGGTMSASQEPVDQIVVELEYNNGLLREANKGEVSSWVDQNTSVEAFMRSIQASAEHIQVLADQQVGVEVRKLLGVSNINSGELEAALKAKYGGGSSKFKKVDVYVEN